MKLRSSTVLFEDSAGRNIGSLPLTMTVSTPAPTCSLNSRHVVFPTCTRTSA